MPGRYQPFKDAVEARDLDAMIACFAPDATFHSPVVFTPYHKPSSIGFILAGVMQVFETFEYVDVLDADDRAGLVFRAGIGDDKEVEGWDYLTFDDEGRITNLTVMLRPMSGLLLVAEKMKALLASGQGGPA